MHFLSFIIKTAIGFVLLFSCSYSMEITKVDEIPSNKRKRADSSDILESEHPVKFHRLELTSAINTENWDKRDNGLFSLLDNDLKHVIFDMLTVDDLLMVGVTCRYFNKFTQKEGTTLEIGNNDRWLPFYPNLTTLNLSIILTNVISPKLISITPCKREDRMDEKRVKMLAAKLKMNTSITSLNLDGRSISPQGAEALAHALTLNTTLTNLDLNYTDTTYKGATALAEALKKNSTVTALNLRGNPISLDGVIRLLSMLEINTSIKILDLSYVMDTKKMFGAPDLSYLQFVNNLDKVKKLYEMEEILWAVVHDLKTKNIISPESQIENDIFVVKIVRFNREDSL